jgi:DNA (cytosine-5)-methyltransferase 1
MTEITAGSLFSGIGGIDLGLERVGMTVKWQSEIEPYSCRVLNKHWPHVPNLGNIREVNWEEVERVDVIAGGYPCQPFSTAGKRGGSDDPRHLWPEMLRAISVLRPRVAFLENVRGHYSLGFDRVLGDLADIGYDCQWEIVSAQSVGAPHRRERLICLAYPNDTRGRASRSDADRNRSEDVAGWFDESQSELGRRGEDVANANGERREAVVRGAHSVQQFDQIGHVANATKQSSDGEPDHFRDSERPETIPKLGDSGGSENGSGQWWEVEPDVGRVAHGIPARVDRLRGLGNAVVPQVAEVVGRVIMEMLTPV